MELGCPFIRIGMHGLIFNAMSLQLDVHAIDWDTKLGGWDCLISGHFGLEGQFEIQ